MVSKYPGLMIKNCEPGAVAELTGYAVPKAKHEPEMSSEASGR